MLVIGLVSVKANLASDNCATRGKNFKQTYRSLQLLATIWIKFIMYFISQAKH